MSYSLADVYDLSGNDSADDRAALQDFLLWVAARGGGKVHGNKTSRYLIGDDLFVPASVALIGANIHIIPSHSNVIGVRPRSGSSVLGCAIHTSTPPTGIELSSQKIFGACIGIGVPNGQGGPVDNYDPESAPNNIRLINNQCSNDNPHRPVIQGMGEGDKIIINGLTVPDGVCSVVHWDWGDRGTGIQSGGAAQISATRDAFERGECYTTHCRNLFIDNVRAGRMNYPATGDNASYLVRLSGCDGVIVGPNMSIEECTGAAYFYTAGDLGREFARDIDVLRAHRGVRFYGGNIKRSPFAFQGDTRGDNVDRARADGYQPRLNPLYAGDIQVCNLVSDGAGAQVVNDGIRIEYGDGFTLMDNTITNHAFGSYCDHSSRNVKYVRGLYYENELDGIATRDDPGVFNIGLDGVRGYGNGRRPGHYGRGFAAYGGRRIWAMNCDFLMPDLSTDPYQISGVTMFPAATETFELNNF